MPINQTYLELLALIHHFLVKCLEFVSVVTLLPMQVVLIPAIYTCHFALNSITRTLKFYTKWLGDRLTNNKLEIEGFCPLCHN